MLDEGTLSSAQLVLEFVERIDRLDPGLGSVIAVNPNALEEAQVLDQERGRSGARSPVHGIPLLVKDNIETLDPLPTTAGSLALRDNRTGRDAEVVACLRSAGTVILGKTNLSEWANFRSIRSTSGWSAIGGQARNPFDPTRSPGGSSSGSAIAVAAGFAAAAIGTETNGSLICPASLNGVVCFKPAVGELSQLGIVPVAHSQDTAGPMTRSVVDAVLVAAAMAGEDHGELARTLVEADAASLLAGRRIGVVRSYSGFGDATDALLLDAVGALCAAGAEVVDDLRFALPGGFGRAMIDVMLYEFKHGLDAYLATLPGPESALRLRDLISFNAEHADEEMPHFGQEFFELAEEKTGLDAPEYVAALRLVQRATREEGIDASMERFDLDALISPSASPAWPIDPLAGDPRLPSSATHAAVAGYPHLTVPMGAVDGLPVGLSFFARPRDREALLRVARGYELVAPARRRPEL